MKKVLRLIFVLTMIFVIEIKGVRADSVNVVKEYIDGIWSFHYRNGSMWTFGNLQKDYANGDLVYCIQPDASLNTSEYYTYDNFDITGYSEYDKSQMELISYYGYGYPGHDNIRYFMATQELLWLFSPDEWITWNTSQYEDGENIDISYEKNEIKRLVNNHNKKPSFYGSKDNKGSSYITLTDNNGVLDNYDIETNNNITYQRNGNSITFYSSILGNYNVNFVKRRYIANRTLAYNNESIWTQKLAMFGEPYFENFTINLNFDKSDIIINKKDLDTSETIINDGIKVLIKDINNNTYLNDVYEFKDGIINITLPVGKYKIEEIEVANDYSINKEGLEFEITENDSTRKNIDFYNKKVYGKIDIYKQNEDGEYLSGVKFDIYNDENEIVDEIETIDGIASSKELELGNYKVKEKENIYGYEPNDTIYNVNLSYKDQNTSIVIEDLVVINKKIKCEITLITSSGEEMLESDFNIYDKDMNLVYSGKTINGKAEVSLPYGEYILKEIGVPDGYLLNEEEIKFSVNDITCASNFKINNEKVYMPITTSSSSISYLILLLINIISYVFYKKSE